MTRILITGCRSWKFLQAGDVVDRFKAKYGNEFILVHGDCPSGVDAAFEAAATERGILTERHPANWDADGPSAGPKRNAEMVALGAEFAVAVHRSLANSKGTQDCVVRCLNAGIPVYLIDSVANVKGRRIRTIEPNPARSPV